MDYQTATDIFRYEPSTGKLYWANPVPQKYFSSEAIWKRFNTQFAGTESGTPDTGGYLQTRWKGKAYRTHRIIWLITYGAWPSKHIDHGDHNRKNNRLNNLSDVCKPKNNAHKKNNTSGYPNIRYEPRNTNKPWCVAVFSKGVYLTMTSFADLNDAIAHRDTVRAQHNLPAV